MIDLIDPYRPVRMDKVRRARRKLQRGEYDRKIAVNLAVADRLFHVLTSETRYHEHRTN